MKWIILKIGAIIIFKTNLEIISTMGWNSKTNQVIFLLIKVRSFWENLLKSTGLVLLMQNMHRILLSHMILHSGHKKSLWAIDLNIMIEKNLLKLSRCMLKAEILGTMSTLVDKPNLKNSKRKNKWVISSMNLLIKWIKLEFKRMN